MRTCCGILPVHVSTSGEYVSSSTFISYNNAAPGILASSDIRETWWYHSMLERRAGRGRLLRKTHRTWTDAFIKPVIKRGRGAKYEKSNKNIWMDGRYLKPKVDLDGS
eukprot:2824109-Pleurochrysis_carterae.AAC.2